MEALSRLREMGYQIRADGDKFAAAGKAKAGRTRRPCNPCWRSCASIRLRR